MKKIFLAATTLMLSQFASAQYMGIKSLPSSDNLLPEILQKAILEKNSQTIEQWRKDMGTFTFPYDKNNLKNVCIINTFAGEGGRDLVRKAPLTVSNVNFVYSSIPYPFNEYPIFAPCNQIPLMNFTSRWSAYNNLNTAVLLGKKITPEMEYQTKYGIDFINALNPNQFEQLILVLQRDGLEPQIKDAAWNKFVEFWPKGKSQLTEAQKILMNNYTKWFEKEGKNIGFVVDNYDYLMLTDPVNYLFYKELNHFLKHSQETSNNISYSGGDWDKFTKKFFLGEENIDLKKSLARTKPQRYKDDYILTYESAQMLKKIMAHPEFKMNLQNPKGETFLHYILKSNDISDNTIAASFVRAALESGAKVELKNKDALNPYEYFIKNRKVNYQNGENNPMQPMIDAFHLEVYEK